MCKTVKDGGVRPRVVATARECRRGSDLPDHGLERFICGISLDRQSENPWRRRLCPLRRSGFQSAFGPAKCSLTIKKPGSLPGGKRPPGFGLREVEFIPPRARCWSVRTARGISARLPVPCPAGFRGRLPGNRWEPREWPGCSGGRWRLPP